MEGSGIVQKGAKGSGTFKKVVEGPAQIRKLWEGLMFKKLLTYMLTNIYNFYKF